MDNRFDYIIVGAGTAGCVLANRLSSDPRTRVLLLEAGDWDRDPLITIPMGAGKMLAQGLHQWGDISEPDAELGDRQLQIPHGRVLGGSGSINFMAHMRGLPQDFEGWVKAGATGWSFDEVLPFFREVESWEKGGNYWRGGKGEVGVVEAKLDDQIYAAWFDMLRSQGYRLTADFNGKDAEGFGTIQYAIRNGQRSSSARAFLHPVQKRPNLTVLTGATVTRLLLDGRRQIGVDYLHKGQLHQAFSGVRTALCLGAINTPHLLMLSGIGPAKHLSSMGLAPIADLPVGQGLEDHLGVATVWHRQEPGSFHRSMRLDRATLNMARAALLKSGPATKLPAAIIGWYRSHAGLDKPDLQFFLQLPPPGVDLWFPGFKKPYADGFTIRTQLVGQKSRGEVLLRSSDPMDRPVVHYRTLSAPEDLAAMRQGYKLAWSMGSAAQLAPFRGALMWPPKPLQGDEEIDAFIRASAIQLYHPSCTCRMGDEDAVLTPDLEVRGIDGLSVVDASAMPGLVSVNPNFAVMMMAAKAAANWTGT